MERTSPAELDFGIFLKHLGHYWCPKHSKNLENTDTYRHADKNITHNSQNGSAKQKEQQKQ